MRFCLRVDPDGSQLTIQQAADHLNVSRPFLIKLPEELDIPITKIGQNRHIKAEDLFSYKAKRDARRSEALSDMAKLDAEKGYL
jgi:excisionase family DNA binding protein